MFKTILLCTDGSEQSVHAAHAAADLARKWNAQLIVLTVFDDTAACTPYLGAWQMGVDPEALARYAADIQHEAERSAGRVIEEAGLSYQLLREMGHPVDAIVDAALRKQVDLVVMGSRGMGAWKSAILGSVSDGVAHHARCPVLIVRGEYHGLHHLLVGSDGSQAADKATAMALKLAAGFEAELTILNVFESLATYPGVLSDDLDPELYAERVRVAVDRRVQCLAEGADANYKLIQEAGHPAQTIVKFADENRTDLIVMGNRGMGPFKSLLLGSVSDRVLHHAHCPVLIVR
jgi:nucleotide-binding universal stress UspA family protein